MPFPYTLPFNLGPKTAELTDEFTTQDTAKWIFTNATASGGRAQMPHGASSNIITAAANYDLTSSSWFVECVQVSTNTWVYCYAPFGSDEYAGFRFASGTLHFAEWINDVMDSTSVAYSSTTHRWVRLRESGGTLFWDTSPDSITWTNQRSKTAVNSYTNVRPEIFNDSSATGDVIVDHFNLSVPPTSSLTDDFTTNTGQWTLSAGATISGGKLNITTTAAYDSARSISQYDFTGSSVFAEIVPSGSAAIDETYLELRPTVSGSTSAANAVGVLIGNSAIFLFRYIGGGSAVNSGAFPAYNATNHRWVRLRESAGTVYLDVSATGSGWTQIDSLSASTLDLTSMEVDLYAAKSSGSGTATFDNVNTAPTVTTNTGQFFVMF